LDWYVAYYWYVDYFLVGAKMAATDKCLPLLYFKTLIYLYNLYFLNHKSYTKVEKVFLDKNFIYKVRHSRQFSREGLLRKPIAVWTKHGYLLISPREYSICLDICICMDVESNPGPYNENNPRAEWNSEVVCIQKSIKYTRRNLFDLRSIASKPDSVVIDHLKGLRLYRYRGSRAGKRCHEILNRGQSITVLNRVGSRKTCRPLKGICRENLIPINVIQP
jgi:hypothetical protein